MIIKFLYVNFVFGLFFAPLALGQVETSGRAVTTGPCSVAHSGNQDHVVINCGVGIEQGRKIIELLNKIASKTDTGSLDKKLDEVLDMLSKQGELINNVALPKVNASQQAVRRTSDVNFPWETNFTITTTGLVQTGNLRLTCTGPVLRAGISRIDPTRGASGNNGPSISDPNTVIYELEPEMLGPGKVVSVAVYSKEPIRVVSGMIGAQTIVFDARPNK